MTDLGARSWKIKRQSDPPAFKEAILKLYSRLRQVWQGERLYVREVAKKGLFFSGQATKRRGWRILSLRKNNFLKLYLSYFKTKKSSFCH